MKRDSGSGGFSSLMSAVLEKQTLSATAVWQLLLLVQETKACPLSPLMEEMRREPGAGTFFRAGRTRPARDRPHQKLLSDNSRGSPMAASTALPLEIRASHFVSGYKPFNIKDAVSVLSLYWELYSECHFPCPPPARRQVTCILSMKS